MGGVQTTALPTGTKLGLLRIAEIGDIMTFNKVKQLDTNTFLSII